MAGCLSANTDQEEAKTLVSRVHTLSLDRASMSRAEAADDPEEALKELLRSDLVVRVGSAGEYSIEYTTRLGIVKTERLLALAPGLPATVTDVDPFAPAKLLQGTAVVFERKASEHDWWHVGDVPLGVTMTPGAGASYASKASVVESLALSDLDLPEGDIHLDTLKFTLRLATEGTLDYTLGAAGADGSPLEMSASYAVPAGQGDILTAEIKATQGGAAGTAGVKAGLPDALAKGGVRLWITDGQPVAGQFTGGEAKADPQVVMWADGFFGEMAEGSSCAGKSEADRCEPEEIESFSETMDASEKEEFPVEDYPRIDGDAEAQKVVNFLKTLFGTDIVQGDKVQLIATFSEDDLPGAPSDFDMDSRTEFVMEAMGIETLTVGAGTFQAMKFVQTFRSRTASTPVAQDGQVYLKALDVNETITRATYWLDAQTWQPLKMTLEMPVDIDRLFRSVLAAVGDDAWEEAGMDPVRDDQWRVTAKAEASYEATRIDPTTRFAPVVGLAAAQALSSYGMTVPMMGLGMAGMPFGRSYGGYDDPYPYGEAVPATPMRSLALSSNGALVDGVKSYTVASASPGFYWEDVRVTLDDETIYQDAPAVCAPPMEGYWVACRGTAVEESYESIDAGDAFRVSASSGQTLRFLDAYSDAVILTLRVA